MNQLAVKSFEKTERFYSSSVFKKCFSPNGNFLLRFASEVSDFILVTKKSLLSFQKTLWKKLGLEFCEATKDSF
jgi:hypothetical protein